MIDNNSLALATPLYYNRYTEEKRKRGERFKVYNGKQGKNKGRESTNQ